MSMKKKIGIALGSVCALLLVLMVIGASQPSDVVTTTTQPDTQPQMVMTVQTQMTSESTTVPDTSSEHPYTSGGQVVESQDSTTN